MLPKEGPPDPMPPKLENDVFWLEEYKAVGETFRKFLELYGRAFSIFLAVTALLLRFSVDKSYSESLRLSMAALGLIFCGIFAALILSALWVTRVLARKRGKALTQLGITPHPESEYSSGVRASWVMGVGVFFVVLGWLVVLYTLPLERAGTWN